MSKQMQVRLSKVKLGEKFSFDQKGPVFVKCRGGYKFLDGHQLHACSPSQLVYITVV
jgi:hypothetical protein